MSKSRSLSYNLIHGLYGKKPPSPAEKACLSAAGLKELEAEIIHLRLICGRMGRVLEENGLGPDAGAIVDDQVLRLSRAQDAKLASLLKCLRLYSFQSGESDEYQRQIREGEFLARKRLKVFDYLDPSAGPVEERLQVPQRGRPRGPSKPGGSQRL